MNVAAVRRVAGVLAVAIAFGAAMAWIKGNNAGLRDAVGNASAPWLLLPFLSGAAAGRRLAGGALVGLLATLAALAGFYVAESFVLELGPHPWLVDLSLTMTAVPYWTERALLSGPLFGLLGVWWHQRRSVIAAGLVAAAFVLEPAGWWAWGVIRSVPAYYVSAYPWLWLAEVLIGVVAFVLLVRHARQQRVQT